MLKVISYCPNLYLSSLLAVSFSDFLDSMLYKLRRATSKSSLWSYWRVFLNNLTFFLWSDNLYVQYNLVTLFDWLLEGTFEVMSRLKIQNSQTSNVIFAFVAHDAYEQGWLV